MYLYTLKSCALNDNEKYGSLSAADFERLFRTRFKPLVVYALRFVKDLETARGLVQDVFITLWEKREALVSSQGEPAAYLTTSVRNRCLNYLRDQRKFNRDLLDFEGLMPDDDSTQPSDGIELSQLNSEITAAISQLPEKCRQIFTMSRFDGKKYQEIADELGISIKTVETQMSRALTHLRSRLAAWLMVAGVAVMLRLFLTLL